MVFFMEKTLRCQQTFQNWKFALLGFVIKNDEKSGVDHQDWKWMEMVDGFGADCC